MNKAFSNLTLNGNLYYILFLRLILILALYTVCRLGFLFFNLSYFPDMNWKTLTYIMAGGLRFDIAAILYTNALVLILTILPFYFRFNQVYQKVVTWIFYVLNSLALAINVADFIYFRYTFRRTTGDIFKQFENETNLGKLFFRFIIDYWYATIFCIALVIIMILVNKRLALKGPMIKDKVAFYVSSIVIIPVIAYFSIIAIRGSFTISDRPLTISDAGKYVRNASEVSIVLNTPFSLLRTLGKTKIKRVNYFASEAGLDSIFSPVRKSKNEGGFKKLNVVIIVLEGFSKEFFGFYYKNSKVHPDYSGYTPFLDSLIQQSYTFEHSFANGHKSIDALPSILAGIPKMGTSYILSPFSGNKINGLGSLLKSEGYQSSFFHGAPNGSMGFDAFMNIAGVEKYYGMTEYNNDADYDDYWGIWDEKFLSFAAKTQREFNKPFLSIIFTVSSHHPYSIPKEYKTVFKEGKHPILKCIQYTDHALKKYFQKISTYEWYPNTLFVITADHTAPNNFVFEESMSTKGQFSIPIVFFQPDGSLKGLDSTRIIHHADIMPTILGQLNYPKHYIAFGQDVFANDHTTCAWNYKDDVFQFYEGDYLLQFDGTSNVGFYNFKTDLYLRENIIRDPLYAEQILRMETKIKAIIQQYNNRMVDNNLTYKDQ